MIVNQNPNDLHLTLTDKAEYVITAPNEKSVTIEDRDIAMQVVEKYRTLHGLDLWTGMPIIVK